MAQIAASVLDQVIDLLWFRLDTFILMLLRVGALVMSSPVFGRSNVPVRFRAGFAVILTYAIMQSRFNDVSISVSSIYAFAGMCAVEIFFGLIMGWVTTLFFASAYIGGQIIDMQMGFGMVNIYDPQTNAQVPVFGAYFNVVLMLVFLVTNGHLRLISILSTTLDRIPLGTAIFNPQLGMAAVEVFANVFLLSVSVSMPILAAIFITEIAMGVIIRTVPQINMFAIGFPLKIALGFIMVFVVLPVYVQFCPKIFNEMYASLELMFTGMMSVS